MNKELYMDIKETVQYIKNEMQQYNYYKRSLKIINWELKEIAVKLEGVSSQDFTKIRNKNHGTYNDQIKLSLMEDEEQLILRQRQLGQSIKLIDDVIELMGEPYGKICEDIYIKKTKTYDQYCNCGKIFYSIASLKRKVNAEIRDCIRELKII